jgi:hypothetical protein
MSWDQVCKRAAGRARYNAWRQRRAAERRWLVWRLLDAYGGGHGTQARIARTLGVSKATITSDLARLHADRRRELYGDPTIPRRPLPDLDAEVRRFRAVMAAGHRGCLADVTDAQLAAEGKAAEAAGTLPTAEELRERLERFRRELGLPNGRGPAEPPNGEHHR